MFYARLAYCSLVGYSLLSRQSAVSAAAGGALAMAFSCLLLAEIRSSEKVDPRDNAVSTTRPKNMTWLQDEREVI
jgi:hypothetical protein